MSDSLRFKVIDWTHGLRCRGVVLHAADGIICLLCNKEWACSHTRVTSPVKTSET